MNTEQQRTGIALLVWAIVWASALVLSTMAVAQNAPSFHRLLMPEPILQHLAKRPGPESKAIQNPTAHKLALERYRLVNRLEPKFGFFPLWQSFDVNFKIVFPRGHSDRVYILAEGTQIFSKPIFFKDTDIAFFCFEEKNKKVSLVYRIPLRMEPSKPHVPMTSLMNYLNAYPVATSDSPSGEVQLSFAVLGKISHAAQQDLETQRGYVQYDVDPLNNLRVVLLSDLKDDQFPTEDQTAYYDLDPDQFFSKNGFPVAKGELAKK